MPRLDVLRHVPSPAHRTCLVDGAATRLLSDLISDRILMSFTRMDTMPVGENVTILDDGRIKTNADTPFLMENFKTIEFTIDMRPDVAVIILNSLINSLKQMTPERRAAFGIHQAIPDPITLDLSGQNP